eukprot:g6388.t1
MSCLTNEGKKRFIKSDPFKTPGNLEASMLGALNGYFVLPTVVLVYAILLSYFNTLQSNSVIEVTTECTPLNFTCKSNYGCEIAPLGTLTTEKFSKSDGINILEKGETATELVCPGQNEALDMAPRTSLRIVGEVVPRSLAYNNFGYFMKQPGVVVYKVNLTGMNVIQEKKIAGGRQLVDAFQVEKYGYFVTQEAGFNLTVYKMDLGVMEIVGTGTVVEIAPVILKKVKTPAYGNYAYFLLLGSRIAKFNLKTMKIEKERSFPQISQYFDWGVISGYKDFYSRPQKQVKQLYVKEFITSTKMWVFDMETLDVKNVTDLGESNIESVCSTDGIAFGEIRFGTAYGKTKSINPRTLKVDVPVNLKYDQDLNFPITALLCDEHDDGIAGISPHSPHRSSMAFSYAFEGHGTTLTLDGARELRAPINTPDAVYFLSIDDSRMMGHVLKLDKYLGKGRFEQHEAMLKIPNETEPIGIFQNSKSMNFPPKGSKRKIFSLFRSTTTFASSKKKKKFEYAFWPEYAHSFEEEDCKTSQPNFLCRRVNLAPTELKIFKSYKYGPYVIATLCLTAASTIYKGLKMMTRHGPKIYDFLRNKCCNRESRESNLSSRLLQIETGDSANMVLLPNAGGIDNPDTGQNVS